jgi:hypothetical protein
MSIGDIAVKYTIFILLALLLHCTGVNQSHGLYDEPPGISSFSAFPSAIQSGETAVLSAFFRRAETARIEPELGAIDLNETNFRVTPAQTTTYTLTVGNSLGTVTRQATVMVNGPGILVQPENVTVTEGEDAEFSVTASGQSLQYQWRRDSADVPGATGMKIVIENVTAADNGAQFKVVISNAGGTVTSTLATLASSPVTIRSESSTMVSA